MDFDRLKRREFITLVGGAVTAAWPLVARAQRRTMQTIIRPSIDTVRSQTCNKMDDAIKGIIN